MPGYQRILLKLSGEALAGAATFGIDAERVKALAREVADVAEAGVQVGVVVGGGNIFRGLSAAAQNMDRVTGDHMGMLATVINSLALSDALEQMGVQTRVMSAIEMHQVAEPYIRRRAIRHLEKGRIVIFAAGTSNPYFSTDTAATLRALEIKADIIAKGNAGGWRLRSRPPEIPGRREIPHRHLPRGAFERPGCDGCHIDRDVPRQQAADYRFQFEYNRQYNANVDGRARRHRDSLVARAPPAPGSGRYSAMKTEAQPAAPTQTFNNAKEVEANMKTRMDKAITDLQHEMASIRTGRAAISLLDNIRVDYYGTPTPLNQIANLHVPEPSMITIQPWDVSQIGVIEKAIRVSDLGLNPSNDGKIVRLPIPPLTEERRKDLVKKLHAAAEHHRVSVRNIRRDANEAVKKLLKDKKVAEDDEKRAHDEIQKLTDSYMAKIDQASKTKEKEILEI